MKNENNSSANENTETIEKLPSAIGVTVTYQTPINFFLRVITQKEEKEIRQKMFGLTEDEQLEQSYENNLELLKKLEVRKPEGIEDFDSYFATRDGIKERIAEFAVRGYFVRLQPEISFFQPSAS